MNEIKLDNIRIGGREPINLVIGELTWKDEEEITELSKEKHIDIKLAQEVVDFNPIKARRYRFIRSIKSHKVSEDDFLNTPKIDVKRIVKAYDELNELGLSEKRGS